MRGGDECERPGFLSDLAPWDVSGCATCGAAGRVARGGALVGSSDAARVCLRGDRRLFLFGLRLLFWPVAGYVMPRSRFIGDVAGGTYGDVDLGLRVGLLVLVDRRKVGLVVGLILRLLDGLIERGSGTEARADDVHAESGEGHRNDKPFHDQPCGREAAGHCSLWLTGNLAGR